jgi:hypothetical protein
MAFCATQTFDDKNYDVLYHKYELKHDVDGKNRLLSLYVSLHALYASSYTYSVSGEKEFIIYKYSEQ